MNNILIYKAEVDDGIVDKILASASIAYLCSVKKCELDDDISSTILASANTDKIEEGDLLYPTQSVLVTTTWNRNDDVFSVGETWAARHTPKHKPTNIEHDHTKIVGHITNTWSVSEKGEVIDDDTLSCDLPDLFHLCNGAVIYKYSKDDGLQEQADKLIEEIEAGTKFVSMECLFPGFDYAISSGGRSYVVSRSDETAFLTKHLRAYGGEGEYNGCRVGRLIKNMIFSGKGYVDTPANPDSIIFDGSSPVPSFSKAQLENGNSLINKTPSVVFTTNIISERDLQSDGVVNPKEHNSMADNDLKNQLDEQKQLVADLTKSNKDLSDQLANANVEKFISEIADLKDQLNVANDQVSQSTKDCVEAESSKKELLTKIDELTKENETTKADIAKIEAEKLYTDRVAVLVSGGLNKADAEEKVTKFAYLNDEQFNEVAEAIVEAKKIEAQKSDVKTEEVDSTDASKVLDDVEIEDTSGSVGATESDEEDNELETAKAGIASYFGSQFGQETSEDNKE